VAVTLGDLKGRISQLLQGYTRNQQQIAWLSAPMTAVDTSFTVDTSVADKVSRGLVEIGNELLLINTFNKTSGLVSIAAGTNGRGRENTTPTIHSINDIVTMDPDYPNQRVTEAINDTIQATYPDLYVMSSFEFPKVAARYEYEMPVESEDVFRVTVDTIGPSRVWFPSQAWRYNPQASTQPIDGSSTGKSLQIMDFIVPGRTVRVMYSKKPGQLMLDSDGYEAVVGYPERTIDMIQYGAVARLLSGVESARLQQKSVESTERAALVPTSAASNASQYFWNMYQKRMNEEVDRLHQLFPTYQTFLA
jgi:hypothetical protein